MMKRGIAATIAAGLAATTLVACGSPQADPGGSEGSKGTIEVWSSDTEGQGTQIASKAQFEKFAQDNGYTVNVTYLTYDMIHEKIIASAAGGNLPDVVYGLPEYVGEFNRMGILADLTEQWAAWPDRDKVSDAVKAAMSVGDTIIGFPYEATVRAYLVHDDLLAEAGVDVPTTWEDVLAVGDTVEQATGSSFFGMAGAGVRSPQELIVYLAQNGLEIAELQEDGKFRNTWNEDPAKATKAAEVFAFYQELLSSGAADPNSATFGWEETDDRFVTGLTATYVTGNWLEERETDFADTMGDISVHAIPKPAGGVDATYLEAKPMFVMKDGKNPEGAKQLAQAIASEEWQKAAYPARSALNTVSTDSKWSRDFSKLVEYGVTFPPVTVSEITQNMIDALAKALQEQKSPEETAAWLSDAINASLERSGELSGAY